MLIEYYATEAEDRELEKVLEHFEIKEWFNPDQYYYVLETDDPRVLTIMRVMNIELYVVGEKIAGAEARL
jgi:hypothetical protein